MNQTSLAISPFNSTMPSRIGSPVHFCAVGDQKGDERRLPASFKPSPNAVIIGRGKASANYPGNKRLQQLVKVHLESYLSARAMHEKSAIVSMLVNSVKKACPNDEGAFVKRKENGVWYEVSDNDARAKVRSLLRPSSMRPSAINKKRRSMSSSSTTSTSSAASPSSTPEVVSSVDIDVTMSGQDLKVSLPENLLTVKSRKGVSSRCPTSRYAIELKMEPAMPLPPSPRQVSLGPSDELSVASSSAHGDDDCCVGIDGGCGFNAVRKVGAGGGNFNVFSSLSHCFPMMKQDEGCTKRSKNNGGIPMPRGLLDSLVDIDPVMDPIPLNTNKEDEEDFSFLFFDDTPLDAGLGTRGSSPFGL